MLRGSNVAVISYRSVVLKLSWAVATF